jgi:uncharacterized protein YndB with AHSA1/START domain
MSAPIARVELLIRKPAHEVWRALIEPEMLSQFWLSSASGPLAVGTTVKWFFLVEGAEVETTTTALVENKRIAVDWSDDTTVEWTFRSIDDGTVVTIQHTGLADVEAAIEATQGFPIVLCDLKVFLETGSSPGLSADKARLIESIES